ncbi:long-chain fatty acid--CoA ligase [Candidatus Albibeggiatoa sp. nov. NOAA]|uniref:AMP-dependent synthetase/ligase n=1 Tax=Candidatus Albibeggiatoa sp. nov. NOAA TaxID=3162724 RepID=UPI0032F8FC1B|nr:long-chain fatty acid--CoA ligase [Thiotrichaceae bacterium]
MEHNDFITSEQILSLSALFRERVKRSPLAVAYKYFDKDSKTWEDLTWQQMAQKVAQWQAALQQQKLDKTSKVAVMLRNSPNWVAFDQAALGCGLVNVPLYFDDRPDNVAYILQHAEVKLFVIEDHKQWELLKPHVSEIESLETIISIENIDDQHEKLVSLDDWLPQGEFTLQAEENGLDDLASIVYTSGTTGKPKGVMLSHRNILRNMQVVPSCTDFRTGDLFLSFLPLSHTLERSAGYYLPIILGATVAYARSIPQLATDLQDIKPTILISVPRIYEQVLSKINNQMQKASWLKKTLFHQAVETGWQYFEYKQGRASWSPRFLLHPLLHKLVGKKVLDKLGGRMHLAICGGAALSADVAKTFVGLGLPLLQGYGLTEHSPVIAVNVPHSNKPASIGLPLPEVDVRLGEQDELLARSHCVMQGYWKNPEATAQVIDDEGWLHTGDKARIDEDGHLYIVGRLKDIIVMGNGEKVPPADMEMHILRDTLFEQVMIIGEGRAFLSALAVLNTEQWEALAKEMNVDAAEGLDDKTVKRLILRRIANQIRDFPGYAQIRRVTLSLEPWTLDNNLLTPTLKLKRNKVIEHFDTKIDEMYSGF